MIKLFSEPNSNRGNSDRSKRGTKIRKSRSGLLRDSENLRVSSLPIACSRLIPPHCLSPYFVFTVYADPKY